MPNDCLWVCLACGKTSQDRFGCEGATRGWDESCMLNAVLVEKKDITYGDNGRVSRIEKVVER